VVCQTPDPTTEEIQSVLDKFSKSKHLDPRWLTAEERERFRRVFDFLYTSRRLSTVEVSRMLGKSRCFAWSWCRRLGIRTRPPEVANVLSSSRRTMTLRHPFSGLEEERFYLQGFAEGDLDVRRVSSTAIMVSTTTTHRGFADCFAQLFRPYGPIYRYPVLDARNGYRWKLASRLENSFSFMLPNARKDYPSSEGGDSLFFAWLAGVIDTDGSVSVVPSNGYARLSLHFYNQNYALLSHVKHELLSAGYRPTGPYLKAEKGHITPCWGIRYNRDMWELLVQRNNEVREILRRTPLRHEEKVMRKRLALGLGRATRWPTIEDGVRLVQDEIERSVRRYVSEAEIAYRNRGLGRAREPFPALHRLRTS
jgi:hypothetical protein